MRVHLLLMLLLCTRALAQTYDFRQFDQEQGLEHNYVYCISQSPAGYLYLSTGEALYRFNGEKFEVVVRQPHADHLLISHLIDSRGRIWVGQNQGGIFFIEKEMATTITSESLINTKISQIAEIGGRILAATLGEGLHLIKDGKSVQIKGDFPTSINCLQMLDSASCLLGTSEGLFILEFGKTIRVQPAGLLKDANVRQITKGHSKNDYWVLFDGNGVVRVKCEGRKLEQHVDLQESLRPFEYVSALWADRSGNLWAGVTGLGLLKLSFHKHDKGVDVLRITKNNGLRSELIQTIFQDNEGNMWFGTFGEGLIHKTNEKFSFYGSREGISRVDIRKAVIDDHEVIWMASDSGLASFERGTAMYSLYNRFSPFSTITSLAPDTGRLWLGTMHSGLWLYNKKNRKFEQNKKWSALTRTNIHEILMHGDSLFLGTTDGLYLLNTRDNSLNLLTTNQGLLHNYIQNLFLDSRKRLWICSQGAPPYYIYNGRVTAYKDLSGNRTFKLTAICEDHRGRIWLATEGDGVFCYNDTLWRKYSTRHGLYSEYCRDIEADGIGNIWVSHNGGLSVKAENKVRFTTYSEKTGLLFPENSLNGIYRSAAGNLWFGTRTGLVQYKIEGEAAEGIVPKIMILEMSFNDQPVDFKKQKIEKPYNYYSVQISFLSVSLSNPEDIYYRYRIPEIDSSWEFTKEGRVDFPKLGDGYYTFEVQACNVKTGLCSTHPAYVSFSIAKPVWKTIWFYVLVGSLLIGITYLIVIVRTRRLKGMQQLLQLKVRQKTFLLQREKEAVEKIKVELEHKNRDITDSIHYARNIQYSILPPDEIIQELFGEDYFVLFKPKDIVSGDFYWAAALNVNNNNKRSLALAAVIDCTGHGVPGAFLSIMANDFLKQSLIDRHVNNTNNILDFLNDEVISHINQSSGRDKISDGMDISIVGVDHIKGKLYYSGANNPVYIYRQAEPEPEVIILRPNKQSIGSATGERTMYNLQEVQLQNLDCIYLFSDGFADQFGGDNNKKLTYKRFRDILSKTCGLPIGQQKQYLDKCFEEWRAGTEQTDDVCVMGIQYRQSK